MSVIVVGHFPIGDISRAKGALAANAALLDEITEDARRIGAIHHRFLEGDGELLVLDEWESAGAFQRFFEGNPKVARITDQAGVQGPPRIEVFTPVEAAGTF